jgi:plasmid stabilization system protein ParE
MVNVLKDFPNLGRNMPDSSIQFVVKDHYQIFYKYANDEIRILHIWDSGRNPDCLELED